METVTSILKSLEQVQTLSTVALVMLSGVTWGYVLRFIKRFPNDGIPVAVVLWCAVANMVMADPRATEMAPRIWVMRNLAVGLIVGMGSWLAHKVVLSRVEDFLSVKFDLGNTEFFKRKASDVQTENKEQTKQ